MAAGSRLGHGNLKPSSGYIGDPARAQNPVSLQVSPRQNDDEADQRLVEQQKARVACAGGLGGCARSNPRFVGGS